MYSGKQWLSAMTAAIHEEPRWCPAFGNDHFMLIQSSQSGDLPLAGPFNVSELYPLLAVIDVCTDHF